MIFANEQAATQTFSKAHIVEGNVNVIYFSSVSNGVMGLCKMRYLFSKLYL